MRPSAPARAAATAALLALAACCVQATYPALTTLPRYDAGGPTVAIVQAAKCWRGSNTTALLWTSVANNQLKPGLGYPDGAIYAIPHASAALLGGAATASVLVTDAIRWATQLAYIKPGSPGFRRLTYPAVLALSGRFPTPPGRFVSPSTPGAISLVDVTSLPSPAVTKLSGDDGACEWYYNKFQLLDINNDGHTDVVTVRFRDVTCPPPFAPPNPSGLYPFVVEFVAYLQPASGPLATVWERRTLYNFTAVNQGPTASFDFIDLDQALLGSSAHPARELLSAEFFGSGAAYIYHLTSGRSWLDPAKTVERLEIPLSKFPAQLGGMYDIQAVNLGGRTKSVIAATTHLTTPESGLYAYEPLGNWRNASASAWARHALVTNVTVFGRAPTPARLRPGRFRAYAPRTGPPRPGVPGLKPLVALATDGGGQLLLLTPASQREGNYTYGVSVVDQLGCDITEPHVADLNADGFNELLAPCVTGSVIFSSTHRVPA